MASAFQTEFAADAVPDLFDEFGETVTQYPSGVSANSATRTVLVERLEPTYDTSRGRETVQKVKLWVPSSVTCVVSDRWIVGGVLYECQSVRPAESGMIVATCECVISSSRREGGMLL